MALIGNIRNVSRLKIDCHQLPLLRGTRSNWFGKGLAIGNQILYIIGPYPDIINNLIEGTGMAGATHQIQIRHILVEKKEVADLLIETITSIPTETGRVQMLMKLAAKYSICPESKEDGGNLGWLEVGWNKNDPRQPRGGFKSLDNTELNDFILDGVEKMTLMKGKVFGPFESYEGFHVGIICQEVKLDRIL